MTGHFKVMKAAVAVVVAAAFAACGGSAPATSPSPTATPSPVVPSASPSPPPPLQRMEAQLPVALEEAAAAVAGGKLYVIGGFGSNFNSLRTVYVFDGST